MEAPTQTLPLPRMRLKPPKSAAADPVRAVSREQEAGAGGLRGSGTCPAVPAAGACWAPLRETPRAVS